MNDAFKKIFSKKTAIFAVVTTLAVGQIVTATDLSVRHASAQEKEIVYCDDALYRDDLPFGGQGEHTTVSYTIDCDEMVTIESVARPDAPSYGTCDSSLQNVCGPMAGTNIVVYYDQYYPNLIPNFEPGMQTASGYRYYPDLGMAATCNVVTDLYDEMNVASVGGTTANNFKNGLRDYIEGQGQSVSYSSVYQNSATVNLTSLATAINQGKVAVVMCSRYNFVYSITMNSEEGYAYVGKVNSTAAHMMFVYGYLTKGFYADGELLCTKTFLYVSSGFGSADRGYMELSDFSVINEAFAISVT